MFPIYAVHPPREECRCATTRCAESRRTNQTAGCSRLRLKPAKLNGYIFLPLRHQIDPLIALSYWPISA